MRETVRAYRVLMSFSFGAAPRQAVLFLLSGVLMALTPIVASLAAKSIVDAALGGDLTLGVVAAALLAGAAAAGVINTLYYVDLLFAVAEKAGSAVDRRLMEVMAGIPGLAHHEQPATLDQLDLLREERGRLGWMTNATAGMVRVAVSLIATGILLARLDPLLLLLPLAGLVSFVTGRKGQELQLASEEMTAEAERRRRHLFEVGTSATAGKELRLFGFGSELIRRHHDASNAVLTRRNAADWRSALLQAAGGIVSGVSYIAAVGLVLFRAAHREATPGDVVLAIGLAAGMNNLVFTAVLYGTSFLRLLRLAGRYLWLQDYARETDLAPASLGVGSPTPVPSRLQGGIDLDDISFHYPGTQAAILDGVSLHLPAGAVVALVGENGAGKTTIVKLLSRFYEPSSGSITVDGTDLRRFDVVAWRERVAAGYQDFARFEFLARETVGVGDLARLEDPVAVGGALVKAGAGDLPDRLADGLETQLGRQWADGVELSGGQWQKLALGRTMMREAPLLLILDEPTASLDAETEHQLFEQYARAAREAAAATGTITLLVSHRFSTVQMADLIVVLGDGRIEEAGSHADLMARRGVYAELYELQARGYR